MPRLNKIVDVSLLAAVLLLIATVSYLGLQLRHANQPLKKGPKSPPLEIGAALPELQGTDLQGNQAHLAYASDGRAWVVYVFAPTCVWCKRNLPNLQAIAKADKNQHHWIGLSTTAVGLPEYVANTLKPAGIAFEGIVTNVPPAVASGYHIGATPEMFVVSPQGRLVAHWRSALASAETRQSVAKYFAVDLPPWHPES